MYEKPYGAAEPVVCLDEKPVSLHAEVRTLDNLNIHCRKALTDQLGEEWGAYRWNRLTVHYTPKHGSWLSQAEIEISLFAQQCLGRRRIPSLAELQREARAWNRKVNREKLTIDYW